MSESQDYGKPVAHGTAPETSAPGDHGHAAHEMHLGLYLGVGAFLLVATVITVWLSYVDFGSHKANVIVAMIVASIKVGFVAAIFMHLKGESKTVWRFLYFTLFFVAGLFLLTLLHYSDPIFGTGYNKH